MRKAKGTNQHKNKYTYFSLKADAFTSVIMLMLVIYTIFILGNRRHGPFAAQLQDPVEKIIKTYGVEFKQQPLNIDVAPKIAGVSADINLPPTVENVVNEMTRVFGPHGKTVLKQAFDIAFCESGWRAEAYNYNTNKTGDYNVFQVNSIHEKRFGSEFRHNWVENIRVAHALYLEQGWRPWVCAKKLAIVQ